MHATAKQVQLKFFRKFILKQKVILFILSSLSLWMLGNIYVSANSVADSNQRVSWCMQRAIEIIDIGWMTSNKDAIESVDLFD